MQVQSSTPVSNSYDDSDSGESFEEEIASWAIPIEQQANQETLGGLLDEIDTALDDPEKAAALEAQGITRESVAQMREELADPEKYDPAAFTNLFQKLENISGQGNFDLFSTARLMLLEFNVDVAAARLSAHESDNDAADSAVTAVGLIEDLAASTSEGEEVNLTTEIVDALLASGLSASDVSSPKLQAILNGEDPSTISFTSDELTDIAEETESAIEVRVDGTTTQLELELFTANNYYLEALALHSNWEKKLHDEKKGMTDKTGNS